MNVEPVRRKLTQAVERKVSVIPAGGLRQDADFAAYEVRAAQMRSFLAPLDPEERMNVLSAAAHHAATTGKREDERTVRIVIELGTVATRVIFGSPEMRAYFLEYAKAWKSPEVSLDAEAARLALTAIDAELRVAIERLGCRSATSPGRCSAASFRSCSATTPRECSGAGPPWRFLRWLLLFASNRGAFRFPKTGRKQRRSQFGDHAVRNHDSPSADGKTSGRDPTTGRLLPGNKLGRGSAPLAMKSLALRAAQLAAVTPEDIAAIAAKLVKKARAGDVKSTRELLNHVVGKPIAQRRAEPLQVVFFGENVLAERADALLSLCLRHAAGEAMDIPADEDAFMATRERLDHDPTNVRRRLVHELKEPRRG